MAKKPKLVALWVTKDLKKEILSKASYGETHTDLLKRLLK